MLDADFDDFDGFDAWARSAAPANHCAYAAQCSGARMPPQGSTDPLPLAEAIKHWESHNKNRDLTLCLMQSAIHIAGLKGWAFSKADHSSIQIERTLR